MLLYASLQSSRGPRTLSCDAQAAEFVSVAMLSRARESIAKSTFIRKTHMIWKTFFRVFAERSPTPYFYKQLLASSWPCFRNFDSKVAKLHFWPKRGQWDPMWSELDSIWLKFDPNWVKLGPKEAQSIFSNSRSTAQADVMLRFCHMFMFLTFSKLLGRAVMGGWWKCIPSRVMTIYEY